MNRVGLRSSVRTVAELQVAVLKRGTPGSWALDAAMKRVEFGALCWLFAMIGGCGVARTQEAEMPIQERVAGCYRLELQGDPTGWRLPSGIVLEAEPLAAWPHLERRYGTVFVARTLADSGKLVDHPFGYWRPLGHDSLFVGHPGAFAGLSMELELVGKDLAGQITAFSDVEEEGQPSRAAAAILARRVDCPTEHRGGA